MLLLVLFVGYRYSRMITQSTLVNADSNSDAPDTSVVLPAVSPAWTNITANAQFRTGGAFARSGALSATNSAETNQSPAEVTVSADALGARAKDLLARGALNSVGVDPDAEQFWLAAINDPNLAPEERQDLIESLDQAGFSDPRRVSPDDLPLIASRIALIEEVAPSAMDGANTAAFQDAYRTLLNMFGSIITTERSPEQSGAESSTEQPAAAQ